MFQSSMLRPLVGLPLAGLVVFGLFSFMHRMISVDFVPPETVPQRVLEAFVAPDSVEATPHVRDIKPDRLELADRPPPPPKLTRSPSAIDLPAPQVGGAVPQTLDIGRLDRMVPTPVAINDRNAQPIRPPVPSYPGRAVSRGLEGDCEVRFDVDMRGKPYNIEAVCSDQVFRREAERAVSRVQFAPKIQRGRAVERRNVVYPLEFRLTGD